MTNNDIFYEIFETVMDELGIDAWYDLFDSDNFDVVDDRIRQYFGVDDETDVDGYLDWYNTMAMDL